MQRGTGGIDTLRGIFPTVIFCSKKGIEQSSEAEIRSTYEGLVNTRRDGRAADAWRALAE